MTIETVVDVSPQGNATLKLPPSIAPGQHRALITICDKPEASDQTDELDLPVYDVGPWPENLSLRREDMYGDWGR
jgi:hypothetical protein